MTNHTDLQEKFPFLTGILFNDREFVGIVQNRDQHILTMYDIEQCNTDADKQLMLEHGDLWWWESNRMLPIDVFLLQEMEQFKYTLRSFTAKEVEVLFGPVTSMQNILRKRIKRRTVQLIKKVD